MQRVDDDAYRLALGLATMQLASQLTELEADEQRRARKVAVIAEKWEVLRSTFPVELDTLQGYGGTGPSVRQLADAYRTATEEWPTAHRRLLLIDVVMGDPFAPYELKVSVDDATTAVRQLAEPLGLDAAELDTVWHVWSDALMAYRPSRWRRPNGKVKQIPALAPADFVPPPAPPEPHGEVGRPDDEAAAPALGEHHLALISGGSLSGAEPDRAGGLWLAEIGPVVADGGDDERVRRLLALPLSQARTELVKLAMAHALVVCPDLVDTTTTTTVLGALGQLHLAVDDRLMAEQMRNDERAPRIRALEEVLRAVHVARNHVEQVRDADEARQAREQAAREATGDVPPIAESLEPPEELMLPDALPQPAAAPAASDAEPAPVTAVDAPREPTALAAPEVVAGPDGDDVAAAGDTLGGSMWAPVALHPADDPRTGDRDDVAAARRATAVDGVSALAGDGTDAGAAAVPSADGLDGELVVDFLPDVPPGEPAIDAAQAAQQRHTARANVVAAAVADVMAMGLTDVADTPVDDAEPIPSPTAAAAIDGDAPNPLRAPVTSIDRGTVEDTDVAPGADAEAAPVEDADVAPVEDADEGRAHGPTRLPDIAPPARPRRGAA